MTGNDMSVIIKLILASLPFAALCFVYSAANLEKRYRGHQFASVFVGLIYVVVTLIKSRQIMDKLIEFIEKIINYLIQLGDKKPNLEQMCAKIVEFLRSIDWNVYIIFLLNVVLLLGFIIIKAVLLPVFKRIWLNENIYSVTSGMFYSWSDTVSCYCLQNKYYFVRKMFKVYFVLTCIIVTALTVLFRAYPDWAGFETLIYSYATVILVGEPLFFLDGKIELEYTSRVTGEDGSSRLRALYYPFQRYLLTIFGDYIIGDKTKFPNFNYTHSNSDIVKKYDDDDSQESRLLGSYFTKKYTQRKPIKADLDDVSTTAIVKRGEKRKGVVLDESLVTATEKLMNGESILFSSPFYNDYSDYIFLPVSRALMKGTKVLVFVCRSGIEDNIREWLNDSLEQVINVPEMWKIGSLNENECFDGEVGIVTSSEILNSKVADVNSDFLKDVSEVIMIEPSRIISTAQLAMSVYVSSVRNNAVYYVFDRNTDGLVDTVSHIIKRSVVDVTPSIDQRNISTYLMWKADGEHLSNRLFPSVARYLGVGTELIIAALREQIRVGEWLSFDKFPIYEMRWVSQQYYKVLCEYATIPIRQEELDDRMLFRYDMWGLKKSPYKYLVVEDEFCNLFEVYRQFGSRATSEAFINILAENYMLREYMYLNPELFESDPKAIPTLSADFARTERNIAIELLLKLNLGFVPESEIVKVLRYTGRDEFFDNCSTMDIKNALYDLIFTYLYDYGGSSPERFVDERNRYYRLRKTKKESNLDTSLGKVLKQLKCVYYILEDEMDSSNYLDAKIFGQVYQSHLPGQHIVIKGKYYEILLIGDEHGVVLKRAGDHVHFREYYRQLRKYTFDSFETSHETGKNTTFGKIVVEDGTADFEVSTDGYLLMYDYGDFNNKCFKNLVNDIPVRQYKRKNVLRITFPGISEKQRLTIAVALNEAFKTLYPDDCNYICAVTKLSKDVTEGVLYDFSFDSEITDECIYIVEDSVLDMGLIGSFKRNFKRIFEIVTDYLEWHDDMLTYVPKPKPKIENVVEPPELPPVPEQKDGIIKRIYEWFKGKRKGKKPEPPKPTPQGENDDPQGDAPVKKEDNTVFPPCEESLAKKKLTQAQKACYDQILEHVRNFETKFTVKGSHNDAEVSYSAVVADHPELFWIGCPYEWNYKDETEFELTVKPYLPMEENKAKYEQLMKKADEIISLMRQSVSGGAYSQALFIHDYIVNNCDYDMVAKELNHSDFKGFLPASTAYGCLVEGKAICAGYTRAYQMIMTMLGAECGASRGGNHTWNYINIDGDYYYTDVTWDDPVSDNKVEENDFDTDVSHDYFCITKAELLKTHTFEEDSICPEATASKCDYFVMEGLYFEEYLIEAVQLVILANGGNGKLQIKFANEDEQNKAKKDLVDESKVRNILPALGSYRYYTSQSGQVLTFKF